MSIGDGAPGGGGGRVGDGGNRGMKRRRTTRFVCSLMPQVEITSCAYILKYLMYRIDIPTLKMKRW